MPNKQVVTFEEVFEAKRALARTLRDFRDFPCEATLTLLIIRLFETIQLVCSYKENKCANYKCVKNRISAKVPTAFTDMRNSLVHEMKNVGDFDKFIKTYLISYSKDAFNQVYELCFEEKCDLYSEIIEFLDDFKMLDIDEDVSDDFEIQDTNDKSSSFEKANTVNAFGDKKIK